MSENHNYVRLYEAARTVHLERLVETQPSVLLYTGRSYDFDEDLAQRVPAIRMSFLRQLI